MQLNRRLTATPESVIRRIGREANTIPGCIRLTIGEPDADAPLSVRRHIAEAILTGDTHYPPNAGIFALREQAAAHVNARLGTDYQGSEAMIAVGSTEALAAALFAILNPGDEVVCLTPCFGLYASQIALAGGVFVPLLRVNGQVDALSLERAVTEKTRAILYASPNNPDGSVLDAASIRALADAAKRYDLFLIADSVYDELCYIGSVPSPAADPALRDRFIYIGALSKTYAMTGVRVGYALADAPVMREIIKAHSFLVVSAPGCIQTGCLDVFEEDPAPLRETFRRRRDIAHARLTAIGLPTALPGGAFYLYPNISGTGLTDEAFCSRLMREGGLALVPASAFHDAGHARLSYCYDEATLTEGLDRLERFLIKLREEGRPCA